MKWHLLEKLQQELYLWVQGKIIEEGTPGEIFEHPKNQRLKDFLSKVL